NRGCIFRVRPLLHDNFMKRNIFILSLVLLLVFSGYRHAHAQIKPGIRMGVNYADVKNLAITENNGVHFGTYLNISLAGLAAVEPGIQFSQRKLPFHTNGSSSKVTLKYLDFPLTFRMSLFPFVNVFGGPQVSVLMG